MMSGASRLIMLLSTPFPLLLRHHRSSFLRFARHQSRLCSSPTPLASLSTYSSNRLLFSLNSSQLSFRRRASQRIHTQTSPVQEDHLDFSSNSAAHPWAEWSKLIDALCSTGYVEGPSARDNLQFVAYEELSEDFVRASSACLAFARDRPELIRLLSKRDIGVIVENGTPFLFKSALDTARRMRAFLGVGGGNVMESDKAQTVDLMKYLLSYASNPAISSEKGSLYRGELVESSVRILFAELARLSYGALSSEPSASVQHQLLDSYGQTTRPLGRKIEMKRGDWICPRCNFMNFARNIKCLECEEARPKRQLTGGEWECHQCNFYNYGRNLVCLRCDCKRPTEASAGNTESNSDLGYSIGAYANKPDLDGRLAANEEKAQRWFTKVSQLDSASDLSSAAADEDFPEIMPLRKGENRFVTSTRKTPLERRLADASYGRNLGNGSSPERNNFQSKDTSTSVTQRLDEILGRASSISSADNKNATDALNAGTEGTRLSTSASPQHGHPKESNSNYVPFVPLPDDMFAKKPQNSNKEYRETMVTANNESISLKSIEETSAVSETSGSGKSNQEKHDKQSEQAEKSETWFQKIAELNSGADMSSTVSDDDFPDMMPMRKGENRFVVSKKKDRSLTTPLYKRRMAMEQASNSNFVPFVPFPPDYFSKKDKQQSNVADTTAVVGETSSISMISETSDNDEPGLSTSTNQVQRMENQQTGTGRWNLESSGHDFSGRNTNMNFGRPISENSMENTSNSKGNNQDGWTSGYSGKERTESRNVMGNSQQQLPGNENIGEGWRGKSLEGSAVEEPDPLDMSEEAKAQRFFRRVAQIKDISELSQIPDEDFPSIMPMRKGVNRFVVSKRKTPLERRLTSPQYRRNLPIVSSDPLKKENDNS